MSATAPRGSVVARAGSISDTAGRKVVNHMKKITIRKTGSIKLTSSAGAYTNSTC